jgi:hypothetical protein
MMENNVTWPVWQKPCEHGENHIKSIKTMAICANGIQYCMELVKSNELPLESCEICIIEWLCDDPIESCMNPENTIQWWMNCPHNGEFWMKHMENALNCMEWMKMMASHWYNGECIKSIVECMEKHEIQFKLVKKE